MKDKQEINRGNCTVPDCECTEYMKPQDTGVRCDYCDHAPVKHVKIVELGACTKCKECPSYESETVGSYSDCEYCECPAKCHEGGDKLFPKRPSQPSPAAAAGLQLVTSQTMSMPATLSVGGTSGGIQTKQFAFSQVQAALKCRLPECNKPCCVEPNGRAHDFCTKAHARAYLAQQQQKPPRQVLQQPPSSMMPSTASVKPAQVPPSVAKICTKCGKKPANPGKGWCQECYIQSKQT